MNNVNQELQHQIEVMKAQKNIELSGPIEEVNNYIQALSRIYELAADMAKNNGRNQEIECLIGILRAMNDQNARAVIVEEWIQKNGPLPLKYGEEVRQILMDGQEE